MIFSDETVGLPTARLPAGGAQSLNILVASVFYLEQRGAALITAKSSLLPGPPA
jgi:hypothetical protein